MEGFAHFEGADIVVVYDMYQNANTVLGGWIMSEVDRAEASGDDELAALWRREHAAVWDERRDINPRDRRAQMEAHARWHARVTEIEGGSGPRAVKRTGRSGVVLCWGPVGAMRSTRQSSMTLPAIRRWLAGCEPNDLRRPQMPLGPPTCSKTAAIFELDPQRLLGLHGAPGAEMGGHVDTRDVLPQHFPGTACQRDGVFGRGVPAGVGARLELVREVWSVELGDRDEPHDSAARGELDALHEDRCPAVVRDLDADDGRPLEPLATEIGEIEARPVLADRADEGSRTVQQAVHQGRLGAPC